jgi:prepilin-type N-terminal cleavage/methylation domain-containing protein
MSSREITREDKKSGFTLVELIVSIAILSIMLLGLGQAMAFVSNLWIAGIGNVDNYTKARTIMSIMDRDIQMMVMRPDVAAFVDSTGANPACAFYTNVQGNPGTATTDTRTVSLVQFLLNPALYPAPTTMPSATVLSTTLGRVNYGSTFPAFSTTTIPYVSATTAGIPLTIGNTTSLPGLSTTNVPTDSVATGVILFQWQFIDGAGNILTPKVAGSPYTSYAYSYNYTAPSTSSNPRAVVVSLLVLNNAAYNLAVNTGEIATIQGLFPASGLSASASVPTNAGETFSQYWNSVLNTPPAGFLALPLPIRSGLRVFQRYIPLPVAAP